jgi:hypothetical protein
MECFVNTLGFVSAGEDAVAVATVRPDIAPFVDHLRMLPNARLIDIFDFLSGAEVEAAVTACTPERVLPPLQSLRISRVEEMDPRLALRFPQVRRITLYQPGGMLMESEGFLDHLIPFLSSFPLLEQVTFDEVVKFQLRLLLQIPEVEGGVFDPINEVAVPLSNIIRTLCEAYATGTLPPTVNVLDSTEGLFCPYTHRNDEDCPLCRRVMETFPLEHLVSPNLQVVRFRQMCDFGSRECKFDFWMTPIIGDRAGGRDFLIRAYHLLMRDD